jgi:hypothetical protein
MCIASHRSYISALRRCQLACAFCVFFNTAPPFPFPHQLFLRWTRPSCTTPFSLSLSHLTFLPTPLYRLHAVCLPVFEASYYYYYYFRFHHAHNSYQKQQHQKSSPLCLRFFFVYLRSPSSSRRISPPLLLPAVYYCYYYYYRASSPVLQG